MKKQKKLGRKLVLNKETVSLLDAGESKEAIGGRTATPSVCVTYCGFTVCGIYCTFVC